MNDQSSKEMAMVRPTLDQLLARVNSKYALVVAAARRARILLDHPNDDPKAQEKPVTKALEEIADGQLRVQYDDTRRI